jgi:IclR family transcriptional regulator, mhp operon transcriptional activator
MLVSSLGRAWLSWCSDDEREATLIILRTRTDDISVLVRDHKYVSRVIQATRKRGYALNQGEWAAEASVIAIGFPIHDDLQTIGAINLVF